MNGNNGNVNNEREALIVKNMNVAKIVAAQYKNLGVEMEDLIGYAHIGLVEAADRYRAEMGVSFRSYASWWCRKEVLLGLEEWGFREAPLPLDRIVGAEEEEPLTFGDMVPDPDDVAAQADARLVADVILNSLPDRERDLMESHYLRGESLPHIARRMGLTPRRIQQLHIEAIKKITG